MSADAPPTEAERLHALFVDHYRRLVKLAGLLCGDAAVAEEVVQEAFTRAHGRLVTMREPDAAHVYLRTTVVNVLRSRGRRAAVAARHRSDAVSYAEPADAAALRHDDREKVAAAIRALPSRQRECIVLRYYEELSEAETAEALCVSVNSVKTHLLRAKARLARTLEKQL